MKVNKLKKLFNKGWIYNKLKKYLIYKTGIIDLYDLILIRRKYPTIPPTKKIWGGTKLNSYTFYKWSLGDLELFKKYGNITPDDIVLDVGCGIGRMAFAFDKFLSTGKYFGFDAHKSAIDFNKLNYVSPKLNFLHVNLKNSFYNPQGDIKPEIFKFPYPDNHFDFIFLISVFTHMTSDSMINYINEINRVLKKGKNCFITFFIIDEVNRKLIKEGKSWLSFKFQNNNFYFEDDNKIEFAVAYDEIFLTKQFIENGFIISEPILYGSWSGRGDFQSILKGKSQIAHNFTRLQDIIVATKI